MYGRIRSSVVLLAVATSAAATPAVAQVARHHLVDKGNLFVATSNPAPLAPGANRSYFGFQGAWGEYGRSETTGYELSAGTDWGAEPGTASFGGSLARNEMGGALETIAASLDGQFSLVAADSVWSLRGSLEARHYTVGEDDTASLAYSDLGLGGRFTIGDDWQAGASYSPEVTARGDLPGNREVRTGHGHILVIGIGWLPIPRLALGLDYAQELENEELGRGQTTSYSVAGEGVLTEAIVLSGQVTSYVREDAFFGDLSGTILSIDLYSVLDPVRGRVFSVGVSRQTEGTPDDPDILNTTSVNLTYLFSWF